MDKDKEKSFDELYKRTVTACQSNNIEEIQKIFSPDCYPNIPQKEKETNIFIIANDSFEKKGFGLEILKYLIFDYKITEELPFKAFHTKEVTSMFEARNLNNELGNSNKTNKKTKL